jgi:hypothetical protein
MREARSILPPRTRGLAVPAIAAACLCALGAAGAPAHAIDQEAAATAAKPLVSATLEQCLTSSVQAERSATFAGEMSAIPGSAKMEMRVDVLEKLPHEITFHTIAAAGLGVWRFAAPGVRSFRYLKEVTNLTAPASYRAVVRFRWLNSRGRLMRSLEARTPRCQQPEPPPEPPPSGEAAVTASS